MSEIEQKGLRYAAGVITQAAAERDALAATFYDAVLAGLISAETLRERMAAGDCTTWADVARRLLATGRVTVAR